MTNIEQMYGVLAAGLWAVLGVAQAGAVPPPPSPPSEIVPNPRSTDRSAVLDDAKVQEFLALARVGDPTAAFRLSRHYAAVEDVAEGQYWRVVAAARGHRVAQYTLGFQKADADDCPTLAEARAWFEASNWGDGSRDPGIVPSFEETYARLCKGGLRGVRGTVQNADRCADGRLASVNAMQVAYADFSGNILPVEHPHGDGDGDGDQSSFLADPQNYEVRITKVAGGHEVKFFPVMSTERGMKGGGGKYMVKLCSRTSGGFSPFM